MKFKGTKGIAQQNGINAVHIGSTCVAITHNTNDGDLRKYDAELISDAFNTIQKCDLLPSQILEQRDELLNCVLRLNELTDLISYPSDAPIEQHGEAQAISVLLNQAKELLNKIKSA